MTTTSSESIPEMMQPNWTGLDIGSFPVKFGQILKFENDSAEIRGIVLDFSEDEGGLIIPTKVYQHSAAKYTSLFSGILIL
ncbi:hypothetical protein Q4534_23805, partial [Cyclobacterium sp. 1_MG-2023]|uniref:hypothetical protein n=1 Tax=Cyclobacterium sp. 1_MG-2023 TaxID=3062681 RepID=UPI0026E47773